MPFAAHISVAKDTDQAIDEACAEIRRVLGDQVPDLTVVFVSHQHRQAFPTLAKRINELLPSKVQLGCAGEFIAGGDREIEQRHALSVWSAVLPDAELVPFHLTFEPTPDGAMTEGWPEDLASRDEARAVLLFGEPFSTPVDVVIARLEDDLPGIPLVGGMASGARNPGQNVLFFNSQMQVEGAVGVALFGGLKVSAIVSQGCRPIGDNYIVTKAQDNIVQELSGKPALIRLQELFGVLSERDQALMQTGPHLGIAINEYQEKFDIGDFLISNVVGADRNTGAIAIGAPVRIGQTVRFHVRDARTADEELKTLLERHQQGQPATSGALLFSCNGRGTRLFGEPHHDTAAIQAAFGHIPLAGFFANGELGPVGRKNHIHGYTASVVCFE